MTSINTGGQQMAVAVSEAGAQAQTFTGGLGGAFQSILGGLGQIGTGFLNGIGSIFSSIFGGLGSGPGFSEGGFTGHGGKYEPAGFVHRGEIVWSQADIARAGGVGAVEGMRRGLRGYADGGHVNDNSRRDWAAYANVAVSRTASASRPIINIINNNGSQVRAEERSDGMGGERLDVFIEAISDEIGSRLGSGRYDKPMGRYAKPRVARRVSA
jgi:phage-related minor tail protein